MVFTFDFYLGFIFLSSVCNLQSLKKSPLSFYFLHLFKIPVFPAPFFEESVSVPLYIFASFVKDRVPIGAWVYFWPYRMHKYISICRVKIKIWSPIHCCILSTKMPSAHWLECTRSPKSMSAFCIAACKPNL